MHKDKRGTIKDLHIEGKSGVTLVTFTKGAVRGNHFHRKTIQSDFILSGDLLCITQTEGFEQTRIVKAGDTIVHSPQTIHAYRALSDASMVSCVHGTRVGEDYSKDTFKYDIIPPFNN
jgi:quercetin dioxygenase-like cupin family protein